jgi:hypothetical protein
MKQTEFKRFGDVLNGVMEVYGRDRSPTAIALWWKVLEKFELSDVEGALAQHVRTSRFAPTPADVVTIICERDGRPGAEEAWAMIPRSEAESVIWTEEMAKAYGVCAPLLSAGDSVAARRAFIDSYKSEVDKARLHGTPVKVTPSWGWDENSKEAAVRAAIERGMLTHQRAVALLPTYESSQQGEALAITNDVIKRLTDVT